MDSNPVAAIDIGSNTTRLLIARFKNGYIEKLFRDHKITRLGEDIARNGGVLSPEAISRTVSAIKGFLYSCSEYGVSEIKAVATSAARSSSNGFALVESIRKETGITAEVISGDREARLTVKGIAGLLPENEGNKLILDIGGGSTELALTRGRSILALKSFDVGVLRLIREINPSDIPTEDDIKNLNEFIISLIEDNTLNILAEFKPEKPEMIATSGTPLTLACIMAGLNAYDTGSIDGYELQKESIYEIFSELVKIPSYQRLEKYGALEPGREKVIIPGVLIMTNIMSVTGTGSVRVTENSLLEGLVMTIG